MDDINFSVSMCVYGGDDASNFKTAVDSVVKQTVLPSEIVIVVDGPVPVEINNILADYEVNPLFNIIRLEKNQGHGIARKIGLQNCKNELIAVMDADDISVPNRFECQIRKYLDQPEVDVVGGMITEFIETPENVVGKRIVPENDKDIKEFMKKRCPMNLVTVMFKKDSVEKAGGFIDWYCEEDYFLWLRMAQLGMHFANDKETLVNVRVGKDMYQRRGGLKYFKSEAKLQKYMLDKGIIGFGTFVINILKRLAVQVLMPNCLRGWFFQKFARN